MTVAAICLLTLTGCAASGWNAPPLSASLADPWDALSIFSAGDKLRVYIDEGVSDDDILQLRGRFVSANGHAITIRMEVDQFSRPPQTGATSLFLLEPAPRSWSDPKRVSAQRRREIEFGVERVTVRGDEVQVSLRKQAVWAVYKPSMWRWAGPLADCGVVSLPGLGIGALSGWAGGDVTKGALIGAAIGCGMGVLFWYGDRSDTAALEWDTVYRRPGRHPEQQRWGWRSSPRRSPAVPPAFPIR